VSVLETRRLALDELTSSDAEFILELLNEEPFVRYIGDKGVRTRADARKYIKEGPAASYTRLGFGLYRVALKANGQPIGICGLLKRDTLEEVDLGFALLERYWSKGYAFESAWAVLAHAQETLGLGRVLAITSPDNTVSIGLLSKLGFAFERMAQMADDEPEISVFACQLSASTSPRRE
jgi:RimJ/RimL family protein N-acetyltransferase